MRCQNCGFENGVDCVYCANCGVKIDVIRDSDNTYINSEANNNFNNITETPSKKSVDKNKIIIEILLIAIIAVIAVTVCIAFYLTKQPENSFDNTSASASENYSFVNGKSESYNDENIISDSIESTSLSKEEMNRKKALDYIDKANAALKNGEREGALQMADAALEVCDDDDIKKNYDKIYEYAPLELYKKNNILKEDPKPYIGYKIEDIGSDNANDGSTLPNCFTIMHNEEADGCLSEITYNLSGKYDVVTGTGYIPSYSKNADQNGYFVIYGDGKKLYTSSVFNSGVLPEKFEINVSGVERLVLSFYAKPYNGGGLSGNNYFTYFGISDFKAIKNLP